MRFNAPDTHEKMKGSNPGYRDRTAATRPTAAGPKGAASTKPRRAPVRRAGGTRLGGPRKNMPGRERQTLQGRGAVDETAAAGVEGRAVGGMRAKVLPSTGAGTLR